MSSEQCFPHEGEIAHRLRQSAEFIERDDGRLFRARFMTFTYLLRLADKLQGRGAYKAVGPVDGARFDLDYWGHVPGHQGPDYIYAEEFFSRLFATDYAKNCGTTACACGWAAADPWFQQRGFNFDGVIDGHLSRFGLAGLDLRQIGFGEAGGWGQVRQFFGLSDERAMHLFSASQYSDGQGTPHMVAQRIRAFLVSDYFTEVRAAWLNGQRYRESEPLRPPLLAPG